MTQASTSNYQDRPTLANFAWLIGLLPVVYAGSRILVVSRGNTETMRALVQDLDVTALVLATLLPVWSTVALWWFISWAANVSNRNKKKLDIRPGATSGYLLLPAIVVLVLTLETMPAAYLIGNFAFLLVLVVCGSIARLTGNQRVKAAAAASVALSLIVALTGVVVLLVLGFGQTNWLPRENVTVAGNPPTPGDVVSSDVRWTRILDEDGTIEVVPSADVTARQSIDEQVTWSDRPLLDTDTNPSLVVITVVFAGLVILLAMASVAVIREVQAQRRPRSG